MKVNKAHANAILSGKAWRQRALVAEAGLRIMVLRPHSKEADAIRKSAQDAYASRGLSIPTDEAAPIGEQMTPVSTETDAG